MAVNSRKELSEKQVTYIVWAAQPDGVREPKTQAEFCQVVGIERATAWRWSKDPRIMDAVRFITLQNAGDPRRVTQLLDMVFEKAMAGTGDIKAAELWIKAVGLTTQFTRGNSILDALEDDDSFKDFSTEELKRLASEAAAAAAENVNIDAARQLLVNHGVDPEAV